MKLIPILILSLASMSLARAHAFLDHADPRVGAAIKTSPHQVKIWFTEKLEPAFSKMEVFDSAKHEIDRRDVHVDKALMTVSVPKLAPGTYQVKWQVVSVDTHRTSGSFSFEVKP